jgi:hypothetical protein
MIGTKMLGEYFSRIAEDDQTELPPFYLQWAVFYGSFTSIAGMLAGACSFEAVDLRFWLWAGLVGFVLIFAIDPRTEWSERPRRWLILTVFSEASRRISPSDEKEEVQSEASDESLFCLVTKLAFLELAGAGVWFVFCFIPWYIGGWHGGVARSFLGAIIGFVSGAVLYVYLYLLLWVEKHLVLSRRRKRGRSVDGP